MRYREYLPPRLWYVWLLIIFALLMVPLCWLPELSTHEARMAIIAQEMVETGDYITPKLFGQEIFAFPVTPWLMTLISRIMPLNELSIRLVGIIPLALLAIMCAWICHKLVGRQAAGVAAAACISMGVLVFQKGAQGEQEMLSALLINGAWLIWFYLGRVQRRWLLGWFLSLMLVSVAILTFGMGAVFLFYFPLLWLRRPMNIWRRFGQWDHWISLLSAGFIVGTWIMMVPALGTQFSEFFPGFELSTSYFFRLFSFPVMALAGTLPWLFLAWPAFCQAFRPLEKRPVFSNYLRTIISSIFFFCWLVPLRGDTEFLLPLIGPFAILIAMNYDLLVRRHGPEVYYVVKGAAGLTLVVAAWAVVRGVISKAKYLDALDHSTILAAITMSVAAVLLAAICIKFRPKLPIWLMVAISVLMMKLLYTGVYVVQQYATKSDCRELAQKLAKPLPKDAVVYQVLPPKSKRQFPAEWFYLNKKVIARESAERELPDQVIYVLSGPHEPIAWDREWTPLTPVISYQDGYEFVMWKGVWSEEVFAWRSTNFRRPEMFGSRRIDAWKSRKGGILSQSDKDKQPDWAPYGFPGRKPAIIFRGNQYLYKPENKLTDRIGHEHCYLVAAMLDNIGGKQTLIDVSDGKKDGSVFQRLVYDPQVHVLTSVARDKKGNVLELTAEVDLSRTAVIAVRRSKKTVDLWVNGEIRDSKPNVLVPFNDVELRSSIGATWLGRSYDDFMDGKMAEIRIHNRWLSDERMKVLMKAMKDNYSN